MYVIEVKRHSTFHTVDDDDSEEINELSRLQDPSSQEGQVDSSINTGADTEKNNLVSPGSQANVPSDQKETNSDVLANMTDFLKEKEDIANDPGDLICPKKTFNKGPPLHIFE